MSKRFPMNPAHPERVCWGCDRYCSTDALVCGSGSVATLHPAELFGEDWMKFGMEPRAQAPTSLPTNASIQPASEV